MAKSHVHENLIYICNAVLIPSCFLLFLNFLPLKWKSFCLEGHRVLVSGLRVEKKEIWGVFNIQCILARQLKNKRGNSFLTLLNSLTTLSDLHMAILCIWTPHMRLFLNSF